MSQAPSKFFLSPFYIYSTNDYLLIVYLQHYEKGPNNGIVYTIVWALGIFFVSFPSLINYVAGESDT